MGSSYRSYFCFVFYYICSRYTHCIRLVTDIFFHFVLHIQIQLNLVMSNSVSSKYRLSRNFLKSRFKHIAFQLNLLLLSQFSMCQNFGYLEVTFQSIIYKSIQRTQYMITPRIQRTQESSENRC